ncbi:MAG: spermidine/putrescine ABC transporter substrate-binding protein [Thermoplasmata archaeon]
MTDRRDFLKAAAAGAAGLTAGAVGGWAATSATVTAEIDDLQAEIDQLRLLVPKELEGLNIYHWTYYLNRPLVFEADFSFVKNTGMSYGVNAIYDTYESNEEAMLRLEAGASGYDIMVITDSYVAESIDKGLLDPIDLDQIPNYEFALDEFKGQYYDPNNEYSTPYAFGTAGIGYNKDLAGPITAWADILEPDKVAPYDNRVTMLDVADECFGATLRYLGYSVNDNDEDHLREALDVLKEQKPYLRGYHATEAYMTGLETGDFWISHAWNGDIAGVTYAASEYEVTVSRALEDIVYIVPEEGGYVWIDNMVMPKDAPHPDAAHAFMNFILDPRVAAINTMTVKYAFPNEEGMKYVPVEIAEDETIFPSQEVLSSLEVAQPFTEEQRTLRALLWLELQAA